ncbi:MAG TPA: tetratricopeptide repeat protein [Xanthomonadales bacterium]|nr:tetratricopeptide repeat protein [Xanthomonadales bacterium]
MKKRPRFPIRRFWDELRRRHVVRVAIYYAAFAWIVIQVGAVLLEAFELAHFLRFLIATVVAGFPMVLVLSWIFDVTPGGIERTAPLPAPFEAPAGSLAVLSFANFSEDVENEYFSDGLSEEIRNQLARVPGLRVAARTSSFTFKDRYEDVREIGRRLNVAAVLEGGVRKQADAVRISLQLVNTADGYQVWSENFERKLEDIFRLQSEIAEAVIRVVTPLRAANQAVLPAPATERFDAYNLYLRGRHYFHKRTEPALRRAVEYFEQAIERDANYALAYSGLSDACSLISSRYYGNVPVDEAVARALPAALRALELAPELAEAHASLGLVRENQGDLAAALQSLRRALELNPAYTMALVWLALVLVKQGRFREAEQCDREALQRDPLSPIINVNLGFDALRYGDLAQAKTYFTSAIEIDPAFPVSHYGLSRAHALEGEFDAALEAMDAAITCAPLRAFYQARKGLLLLQMDRPGEAASAVEAACCKIADNPFNADFMIAYFMTSGDRDALGRVARGETSLTYTADQRGQVLIALGDLEAAREQYDLATLDHERELMDLITDDWIWRLPHVINRAHLWLRAGDARGTDELERLLTELKAIEDQGVVNPFARYWAASANAVLGRTEQARTLLTEARRIGWRHAWWERHDWNIGSLPRGG